MYIMSAALLLFLFRTSVTLLTMSCWRLLPPSHAVHDNLQRRLAEFSRQMDMWLCRFHAYLLVQPGGDPHAGSDGGDHCIYHQEGCLLHCGDQGEYNFPTTPIYLVCMLTFASVTAYVVIEFNACACCFLKVPYALGLWLKSCS